MGYSVHNFLTGSRLPAAALNQMDEQIQKNAEGVALFTMDTIMNEIKKLNLTTDGEYIYLYLGDTLLDEVPVSDASGIIPCEGMTVTSPTESTIVLQAGSNSMSIKVEITPSDCNQSVRFRSSDISVADVTSTGVLTPTGKGTATLTVICGKYKKVFTVSVWERMQPDWVIGEWATAPYTNNDMTGLTVDTTTSSRRAFCFPYNEQKAIYMKTGEKLTVTCDSAYKVHFYYIIKPGNGKLTFTTVSHNGNSFVVVDTNAGGSASSVEVEEPSFTYTADENCYIALMIRHLSPPNEAFTEEERKTLNTKINIRVDPA